MSDTISATATVATDRAARYGKQLASHLGRRSVAVWDDDAGRGTLEMGEGAANAVLTSTSDALLLEVSAAPDDIAVYEDVIGRHLVRFGHRDELTVAWTRSDGTPGTTQAG